MSFSDPKAKAESVPLRVALGRVAEMQGQLAASAARIEAVVSGLVASVTGAEHALVDLQELDLARQSLENLGRLLTTFAGHVPDHVHVPAADVKASVNLGAMVGTILEGFAHRQPLEAATGEIDLFDCDKVF